jgi:hypothetical protein
MHVSPTPCMPDSAIMLIDLSLKHTLPCQPGKLDSVQHNLCMTWQYAEPQLGAVECYSVSAVAVACLQLDVWRASGLWKSLKYVLGAFGLLRYTCF